MTATTTQRNTLALDLGYVLRARAAADTVPKGWPSVDYRENPVKFAREVLGVDPWARQIEILEAVRDGLRVAVSSGHKTGKSTSAAIIALWFFASFDDARVVMTSTTSRQVDAILWRELRMRHSRSGRCVGCRNIDLRPCPHSRVLDGEPAELARTGLRVGFREVSGFTARESEAVAGISGENLLYIVDEASGVPEKVYEGIEGNRAGGARIVMFSNPTRTEGEFFEAFDSKKEFYKTLTISSEESPNVVTGRNIVPGLANRDWVEEKKREWGVESALYKVRVKGEFARFEEGKVLSLHEIGEAELRWLDTPAVGTLTIGLDPAGAAGGGDETAFAIRRGQRIVQILTMRGLTAAGHLANLLGIIREHRVDHEDVPIVVLDREGPIGGTVYGEFKAHLNLDAHQNDFRIVAVRSSERARREPQNYERIRDELWASMAQWIKDGGAIPADAKLARELHAPEWRELVTGRRKVTPKEDLRQLLKRSPDRADAVCLAVWEQLPESLLGEAREEARHEPDAPQMDPYSGQAAWRGSRM